MVQYCIQSGHHSEITSLSPEMFTLLLMYRSVVCKMRGRSLNGTWIFRQSSFNFLNISFVSPTVDIVSLIHYICFIENHCLK